MQAETERRVQEVREEKSRIQREADKRAAEELARRSTPVKSPRPLSQAQVNALSPKELRAELERYGPSTLHIVVRTLKNATWPPASTKNCRASMSLCRFTSSPPRLCEKKELRRMLLEVSECCGCVRVVSPAAPIVVLDTCHAYTRNGVMLDVRRFDKLLKPQRNVMLGKKLSVQQWLLSLQLQQRRSVQKRKQREEWLTPSVQQWRQRMRRPKQGHWLRRSPLWPLRPSELLMQRPYSERSKGGSSSS